MKFHSIDEYIMTFPLAVQTHLQQIRETIRAAAPAAEERISYKQSGKGTIQFPLNRPMPLDLIRQIIEFRVAQNSR